jgi:hypothetical protein
MFCTNILPPSLGLKIESVCSSKMLVSTQDHVVLLATRPTLTTSQQLRILTAFMFLSYGLNYFLEDGPTATKHVTKLGKQENSEANVCDKFLYCSTERK